MFNWLNFSSIFKLILILFFIFAAPTDQPYGEGRHPVLLLRRSEQLQRDSESGTRSERKGAEFEKTPVWGRYTVHSKWQQSPRSPAGYSQRGWTPSTQEEATVMEALPWLMDGYERKLLPYIFHLFLWNIITAILISKSPSVVIECISLKGNHETWVHREHIKVVCYLQQTLELYQHCRHDLKLQYGNLVYAVVVKPMGR